MKTVCSFGRKWRQNVIEAGVDCLLKVGIPDSLDFPILPQTLPHPLLQKEWLLITAQSKQSYKLNPYSYVGFNHVKML